MRDHTREARGCDTQVSIPVYQRSSSARHPRCSTPCLHSSFDSTSKNHDASIVRYFKFAMSNSRGEAHSALTCAFDWLTE
jgi:hypothetical protein